MRSRFPFLLLLIDHAPVCVLPSLLLVFHLSILYYCDTANTQATAPKIETPVVIPEQQLHSSRVAPPTGGEEKDPSLLAFSNTLNGIVAVLDEDDKIRGERAEPEVLAKAISYYQHDRPLRDDIFFRRVVNALTGR